MLCLPAWTPVANDAHEAGDSGEWLVVRRYSPPSDARRAMLGSLPSAIQRSVRRGSMPSNPRMTAFCVNR